MGIGGGRAWRSGARGRPNGSPAAALWHRGSVRVGRKAQSFCSRNEGLKRGAPEELRRNFLLESFFSMYLRKSGPLALAILLPGRLECGFFQRRWERFGENS